MPFTAPPTGRPADLDGYAHRIHRARNTVDAAFTHLNEQRALVSTLKAQNFGNTRVSGTRVSDDTAAAAAILEIIDRRSIDIGDAIATMGTCLRMLETACLDALRTRAHIHADTATIEHIDPHCIGWTGMAPGTTCDQIPTYTFNAAGGIELKDRCVDCDTKQQAEDARRAAETQARRMRRYTSQGAA